MSVITPAVLVIAEHNNDSLKPSTLNTMTAASILGDVDILIAGYHCKNVADAATKINGVNKVLMAEAEQYAHGLAEDVSALVVSIAKKYTHILAPATTYGKNIVPRVAALLDMNCITDISAVESADTFVRSIYAGNALATVQSSDAIKLMTVRVSAFDAASTQAVDAPLESIAAVSTLGLSSFVNQELTKSERPEITAADIIISGGRAFGSAENFKLIEDIANKLNAAIGASRAAVDAGYVPNDYQVGQTGKIVAPRLYIAVGISGAIQHLAGMKDSKVIVAINKDPEAPIFSIANYGLVGDLFQVLPELSAELDKAI